MRRVILLSVLIAVSIWLIWFLYLTGILSPSWLPASLARLGRPGTTSELGDSLSLLEGLFSSVAVVLALVAVLFQSKELKESTKAQNEQAQALAKQLDRHDEALALNALTARVQFLTSEISWYETLIDRLREEKAEAEDSDTKDDKHRKILMCTVKVKALREQRERVGEELAGHLGDTDLRRGR